jgi:hypothetical protein
MADVQKRSSPPSSIAESSPPAYTGGAPLTKVVTREQGFQLSQADKKAMLQRIRDVSAVFHP